MGHQFQPKNVKGSAALQTTATSGLHFWMSALHRARIKTHVIIINAQKVLKCSATFVISHPLQWINQHTRNETRYQWDATMVRKYWTTSTHEQKKWPPILPQSQDSYDGLWMSFFQEDARWHYVSLGSSHMSTWRSGMREWLDGASWPSWYRARQRWTLNTIVPCEISLTIRRLVFCELTKLQKVFTALPRNFWWKNLEHGFTTPRSC